jgi:sialidase-1
VQLTRGKYKGRLVVPLNEGPFGNWTLAAAYSDNGGKTWKIGAKSDAGRGINEVSVVETETGGLFVVSRAWGGNLRKVAYSDDGGESWGPVNDHPELPSPNCQNGLTRYSYEDDAALGNKGRILFSTPTQGRSNGVIKMSYDDGKTWPVARHVGNGPYAYSVLCPVKPGVAGVLFEVNGNPIRHIRFAPFSISWLSGGEDSGMEE